MKPALLLLFQFISASKLLEYRLGYNYGQVFHDFSGNSRDGVNGVSSTTTSYDTTPTDRGAFLNNGFYQITLPSNDQGASFNLPSTFTIATWTNPFHENGLIFYRYQSLTNYFYLKKVMTNLTMLARIVISGSDSGDITATSSSLLESNP